MEPTRRHRAPPSSPPQPRLSRRVARARRHRAPPSVGPVAAAPASAEPPSAAFSSEPVVAAPASAAPPGGARSPPSRLSTPRPLLSRVVARAGRIGATPSLPHRPRLCRWKARARRPHAPPWLVLLAFAPTMTLRLVGGSSQPHRSGRPSFSKAGRLEKNLKEANIARPRDQETTNRYNENERMNSPVHELAFVVRYGHLFWMSSYGSSVVRSTTRDAERGKQQSHDHPIDVPATPTLPDADLRYQEALDWRK